MKLVCLECSQEEKFAVAEVETTTKRINSQGNHLQTIDDGIETEEVKCEECGSSNVIDAELVIDCPADIVLTSNRKCWFAVENPNQLEEELNDETVGFFAKDSLNYEKAIKALKEGRELEVVYKDHQDYEILSHIATRGELKVLFGNAIDPEVECYYIIFETNDLKTIQEIKDNYMKPTIAESENTLELICLNCGKSEGFESDLEVTKSVGLNSKGNIEHISYSNEDEFDEAVKCVECGSSAVYNAKGICEKVDVDMILSLNGMEFSDVEGKQDYEDFYENQTTFIPRESALTLKQAFDEIIAGNEIIAASVTDLGYHKTKWIKQLNGLHSILKPAYPITRDRISFHRVADLKPISILQDKYRK